LLLVISSSLDIELLFRIIYLFEKFFNEIDVNLA
jgi:hypothetical protein